MSDKNIVTINQLIDRKIYTKIKIIAAIDDKKINEVVTDAFNYYITHRGIK